MSLFGLLAACSSEHDQDDSADPSGTSEESADASIGSSSDEMSLALTYAELFEPSIDQPDPHAVPWSGAGGLASPCQERRAQYSSSPPSASTTPT